MPSVGAAGVPRLSTIENWDTEHLESAARSWSDTATLWEESFDQVHQGALRPGGTVWEGEAADAAAERTFADLVKVRGASDRVTAAADIARRGADRLGDLKRDALSAIGDARAAGFTVGEDLSVSDNSVLVGAELAARQAQAEEFAADIHTRALALSLADHEVAANIGAALAPLAEVVFDEPAARQPGGQGSPEEKRTVRAVDVKKSAADSGENAASELLTKEATGEGINDKPLSTDNPMSTILGGTDPGAAVANDASSSGEAAATDSTSSPLAGPIVRADPSVVTQQRARVDSARQALDAAQAKLDAAASQTYTKGGAAGPLRGDTEKLSQAVFDARRELTTKTKILADLNKAAAETGVPTAPVPALPENADVQAFPEQPSEFARASRAWSEGSFGLIPDVAKDVDIFTNWDKYSGPERAGAVLDAAGLVPLPGAKALGALAHGADALNAAHHASGALDDLTIAGHHAGDVVSAPHAPHIDTAPGPHGDVTVDTSLPADLPGGMGGDMPNIDINMKDGWTDFQRSQMQSKIEQFNAAVGDQGFSQVPPVPRDPGVRQEFLNSLGLDRVPPGFHVDHTRDLQAGGLDLLENMGLLDGSVNSSFGSQLNKGMNQFPPGTVFGGVRLPDP